MTKHTSWAIALTATTFLSAPAIAASLAPTLEENSVFSYSEGSENDYNFTLQEPDADGNLSTKYYKIDLKPEAFATSKTLAGPLSVKTKKTRPTWLRFNCRTIRSSISNILIPNRKDMKQ